MSTSPKNHSMSEDTSLSVVWVNCDTLVRKRQACFAKHGDHHTTKKCAIPKLNAKRCLSFQHCEVEALRYYLTPDEQGEPRNTRTHSSSRSRSSSRSTRTSDHKDMQPLPHSSMISKGLCASFDEVWCFGNPQLMNVDNGQRKGDGNGGGISGTNQEYKEALFAHHQKAKRRLIHNRLKFRACQEISERLHSCLRRSIPEIASKR